MDFTALINREEEEQKEEHVPHMEIDKGHRSGRDIVRVVVGHGEPHPNTMEHHIAWIDLYGVNKDTNQVIHLGRAHCAPYFSNPNVRFQVNHIKAFSSFHALAYCNIHGLRANSIERP